MPVCRLGPGKLGRGRCSLQCLSRGLEQLLQDPGPNSCLQHNWPGCSRALRVALTPPQQHTRTETKKFAKKRKNCNNLENECFESFDDKKPIKNAFKNSALPLNFTYVPKSYGTYVKSYGDIREKFHICLPFCE
jgi:hypothetical protein